MARARALALTLSGVMVVALVIAATRDGDETGAAVPPAGARQALCDRLEAFGASLAHLDALGFIDSVADEHLPVVASVEARRLEVRQAAQEVPGADARRLDAAAGDLAAAAPRVPPGTPAARSREQLEPEITALLAAWGQMHERLGCPPAGAAP
jgi:hypothetical protein